MIPSGEVTELLSALIRNECVNDGTADSGHEARSVATLAEYFGQDGLVFEPAPRRQSVLYRVEGTSPSAPRLMLMGHLDVVPANEAAWRHDPFGGEVHDGVIWGRGAVDMLNQTTAMAVVFKRFLDGERPPPPGDLLFLAAADEEAGGVLGAEHVVTTAPEVVACDYLLTEIAAPNLPTPSGPGLPVTVGEKGPFWRNLFATGVPGHGGQPYGTRNALVPMAEVIARLGTAPTPVAISDEWRRFVEGLGLDSEAAAALLDPDRIDASVEALALDDPGYARWVHACTHLTVSPNLLRSGSKANIIPHEASAEVDVRALPGQDATTVDDHFRKVLGPDLYEEIDIQPVFDFPANSSPPEGPLWDAIEAAMETVIGAGHLIPVLVPVATDARFFRARGTVAYGVGLFDDQSQFGDLLAMFHGNDERVSEESLRLTTELLDHTVEQFWTRID